MGSNQWVTWCGPDFMEVIRDYCDEFNTNKNQLAEKSLSHFAFNWRSIFEEYKEKLASVAEIEIVENDESVQVEVSGKVLDEFHDDVDPEFEIPKEKVSGPLDKMFADLMIRSDKRIKGNSLIHPGTKGGRDSGGTENVGASTAEEVTDRLYEAKKFLSHRLNQRISKADIMRSSIMHFLNLSGHSI